VKRSVVPPLQEDVVCGQRRFIVALHNEGDATAKAAAERLVRAEWVLLRTLSANRQTIQQQFYPTLAHKVGVLLDVIEPDRPDHWARLILFGGTGDEIDLITRKLPASVRQAVSQYTVARHEFSSLSEMQ
jgi:hypothetical protein